MTPKRTITNDEKQYLLSLKPDDITLKLLQSLFADTYDKEAKKMVKSKFNTYDEFTLKPKEYFNKEEVKTNCGLFIYNKFIIEPELQEVVGYCNKPLTKDEIGSIQSKLDTALMEDDIPSSVYINFLNRQTWLQFSFNTEVSTSLTVKSMQELPEVSKAKDELKKKYKDDLTSEDNNKAVVASVKMEKELINVAKNVMKNDSSMDLYESGARGAFAVAYKNGQIMKGAVYNSSKHKFDIMYKSLNDGMDKEDLPTMANSAVDSAYAKAISTGECGYLTKKINAGWQSSVLDKRGSDCHTKGYDVVTITKDNYSLYSYNFIIEGTRLVRLDSKTKDKYMGKTVKMRSNAYCTNSKKTCNMCAGDKYYLISKPNYGLTASKISNSLLNKRMKQMHDSTIKTYEIKIDEDFI